MANEIISISSNDQQKVNVKIAPTGTVGGVKTGATGFKTAWSVVSGDATAQPAPDGLSCFFISGSLDQVSKGQCVLTNADGSTITLEVDYSVTAASIPADSFNATSDPAVAK